MATNSIKLLTGNSHPQLAKLVADRFVGFPYKLLWDRMGVGLAVKNLWNGLDGRSHGAGESSSRRIVG